MAVPQYGMVVHRCCTVGPQVRHAWSTGMARLVHRYGTVSHSIVRLLGQHGRPTGMHTGPFGMYGESTSTAWWYIYTNCQDFTAETMSELLMITAESDEFVVCVSQFRLQKVMAYLASFFRPTVQMCFRNKEVTDACLYVCLFVCLFVCFWVLFVCCLFLCFFVFPVLIFADFRYVMT